MDQASHSPLDQQSHYSSSQPSSATSMTGPAPGYLPTNADTLYGFASAAETTHVSSSKPVKRKRLAKACDACHKSKRRCDGTAPCANCDFAGKTCTYTDPSGRAVAPPRSRNAPALQTASNHNAWQRASLESPTSFRPPTPVASTLDPNISPLDPALTRELVNLFFAHCHPSSFLLHRSTFLYNLSRSQVPSYLLLAVFAIAAPYSLQPSLRTESPWHAGERFAVEAILTIFHENPHSSNLPDSLDSLRIKPCLELAQALCLLQAHDCVMRRPTKTDRLLLRALDVLNALDIVTMDQPINPMTHANFIRNETKRRLFWYIQYIELLSSAFTGRPLSTRTDHLSQLKLPIEEALFDLPRVGYGVNTNPEYLSLPMERRVCRSEFANMIRVSAIYAGVMNKAVEKIQILQSWDQREVGLPALPSVADLENDLRRWLELLPDQLRLTEDNLQCHLSQLDGGAGSAAWCFTYMHALAECTVLALHEFMDLGTEIKSPRNLAAREQKALENLTMILGALGQRGRANIMMATLLLAVGRHCSIQTHQVAIWFEEYYRMWGVSLEQLMNNHFRAAWCTVDLSSRSPSPQSAAVGINNVAYDYGAIPAPVGFVNRKRKLSPTEAENHLMNPPVDYMEGRLGSSDESSQLAAGQIYSHGGDSHSLADGTREINGTSGRAIIGPSGSGVINTVLPSDIGIMSEQEASGLGALAVAAAVNGSPHIQEVPQAATYMPSRLTQQQHLQHVVTNGLGGHSNMIPTTSQGYHYANTGQLPRSSHDDSDSRSGSDSPEALHLLQRGTTGMNGTAMGNLGEPSFERGHHPLHSSQPPTTMLMGNGASLASHTHHHHLSGAAMAYHHGGWMGEDGGKMRETVR